MQAKTVSIVARIGSVCPVVMIMPYRVAHQWFNRLRARAVDQALAQGVPEAVCAKLTGVIAESCHRKNVDDGGSTCIHGLL